MGSFCCHSDPFSYNVQLHNIRKTKYAVPAFVDTEDFVVSNIMWGFSRFRRQVQEEEEGFEAISSDRPRPFRWER